MSSRFYDMSYPQYTVHDVSALTGLTPQTIRYYDSIGVVVPQRGAQGQRLYSYYDVLNLVRRSLYKAQGFSLQETEQVLSGAITPRLGALLEEKRADIEEKQRALRLAQLNLDRLSAQLDRLGVCRGRVMYLERPACWHVPYSRDGHICFEEASRAAHSRCGSAFAFSFSLPAVGEADDCVDWDVTMPSPFAEELGFTGSAGRGVCPGAVLPVHRGRNAGYGLPSPRGAPAAVRFCRAAKSHAGGDGLWPRHRKRRFRRRGASLL